VHLGPDLPVTPVRSKGGTDRRVVTANAPGLASAFAFGNAAVLGLQEPRIQILVTAFWEHQDKGLAELISSIQLTVCMAYLFDLVVLLFIERREKFLIFLSTCEIAVLAYKTSIYFFQS